jgi:membrane protein implicated in regulation of membrane protease activity/DNA-binding CsgD family transcriptional regulator
MAALIWIAIALAALIGEAFTTALVLGSIAVAALGAAAVSLVAGQAVQVVVFAVLSLVLLIVVRPVAMRLLPAATEEPSTAAGGPVGRRGVVTERIDAGGGQIRIGSGDFWTARLDGAGSAAPGREVEVIAIRGLTAIVRPLRSVRLPEGEGGTTAPTDDFGLSARELEVLRLLAEGRTNAEIADVLVVSPRTVHHHVSHILEKLNASTRTEAARIAAQHGLIDNAEE